MKVLGIIAEFNPFHQGHEYLLQTAKEACQADYVLVIMSGNFTQRGEPAIYEKHARTRLALHAGADLVLEMPTVAATASARDFAGTGVSLLAAAGCVTHLAFGCEEHRLSVLEPLADLLALEPEAYKTILKEQLREGKSWPEARSAAVMSYTGDPNTSDILKQPNNILALEYLIALRSLSSSGQSSIEPLPIKRIQTSYHDLELQESFSSAAAIRHAIALGYGYERCLKQFPQSCREEADLLLRTQESLFLDDFSQALIFHLLETSEESLLTYLDMDHDLCRRIRTLQNQFTGFEAFCNLLDTRAYTTSRIQRALMHSLLDIRKSDRELLYTLNCAPYLRILGFQKNAQPLLKILKESARVPVLTRPAAAGRQLETASAAFFQEIPHADEALKRLFALDLRASDLYRITASVKSKIAQPQEFQRELVIL